MLVSTWDIFAVIIALGISLVFITTTTIRNAQLYKTNADLRRKINIMKDPWQVDPDHEYESRHTAK